ncbi:hypothetical protein C8F01DRAFT_943908, partial [Mycena amicta]
CSSDAAGWLQSRWQQITSAEMNDDNDEWAGLLHDFLELERAYGWEDNGCLLLAKSRPDPVSAWVRNGRRAQTKVDIPNLAKYESRWWGWWRGNQPKWRKEGSEDTPLARPDVDGGDWDPLNAPGQNGMLLVVASLFWWGRTEIQRNGSRSAGWVRALDDVCW